MSKGKPSESNARTPQGGAKPPEPPAELVTPAEPAKKRSPLLLYGVGGLVVLAALGVGGWFLVPRVFGAKPPAQEAKAEEEAIKATAPLGAVIVNLGGETRRYLRVAVHLGVPSAKDIKAIEEAKPQILDLVITVLSSADVETLVSEDGRAELKEELLGRIREDLGLAKVGRVYFTEFVIQ